LSEEDKGSYILKKVKTKIGLGKEDDEISLTYAISKKDGCYIGDETTAKRLDEKGIAAERPSSDCNVCCIGYSQDEKKWYGWSHRAIKGFGIGDKAETLSPMGSERSKTDIKSEEEAKEAAIAFADSVS